MADLEVDMAVADLEVDMSDFIDVLIDFLAFFANLRLMFE